MKILDRYILFTFIKTFLSIFIILMFILILQSLWLYIKELAGRELPISVILKFLVFVMPRLTVIVLPLAILLSSIMVFGNFAENYEFAAMKSTGISLQRAMKSLIIFIIGLGITAFFFSNSIIPRAEIEFINLRRNIAKVKPALAITTGQFNALGETINIKVDEKFGENDEFLKGVVIHKKDPNRIGNYTVIIAEEGELISTEDEPVLSLKLKNGNYYDELLQRDLKKKKRKPFAKSYFETYTLNIDISLLDDVDFEDKQIDNAYTMLNVVELAEEIDKQSVEMTEDYKSFSDSFMNKSGFTPIEGASGVTVKDTIQPELLDNYRLKDQVAIIEMARSNIKNSMVTLDNRKIAFKRKVKTINKYEIAVHDKYVLAFSCIILFFVGAPLGAIIKKGGLGLPIVIGVVTFLTFHFVGIFAKNSAEDNTITPFIASWLSSFIMLPIGIYFTYRATTDQGILGSGDFFAPLKRMFAKKQKITAVPDIKDISYTLTDQESEMLDKFSSNQLKDVVKNYKQYEYSEDVRFAAIDRLGQLGITLENLKVQGYYTDPV
ncbi:YjgP/YjgQ family permease [Dokdonia sinensis]|uniref:YjgP/YjgQ family permease n=1 Tax=Dokdonia sinensis TaxID=2479847 RepID=A0A3M0FYW0_9FLAO|nr:LptF/LptG family permease [Dokdonia sinensis]RMB57655.1 YjgP/YjgQ family permease [Dokdonia sinensis]